MENHTYKFDLKWDLGPQLISKSSHIVPSKFNRVEAYTYRERPHRRDARISNDQWHGILLQGRKAINWFSPSPSPCCRLGLQCAGICDCAQDIKQKRHVPLRTSRDTDQEKPSSAQKAQDSITGNLKQRRIRCSSEPKVKSDHPAKRQHCGQRGQCDQVREGGRGEERQKRAEEMGDFLEE